MKKVQNKYEEVINIPNIEYVYHCVRKNTKNKKKILIFEEYYSCNITNIYQILIEKRYKPSQYNIFVINDPKTRLIMSQNMGDKIINYFVAYFYLMPIIEKSLINANVATRKNKGINYGVKILKGYLNKNKFHNFYILKCDISKYFYSISHKILKSLLLKKIKDDNILKILFDIIDSTNYICKDIYKTQNFYYKKGYGLPIGNITSRFFAIYYLNYLDHYIKEKLHIKYYLRYMDDFILIHNDKKYLLYCLEEIKKILNLFELKLNDKTCIIKGKNIFTFIGYRYVLKKDKLYTFATNRNKRKIDKMIKLYKKNKISYNSIISYKGYLLCTNNFKLMRKITRLSIENPK